jgi:hypothetical protein
MMKVGIANTQDLSAALSVTFSTRYSFSSCSEKATKMFKNSREFGVRRG